MAATMELYRETTTVDGEVAVREDRIAELEQALSCAESRLKEYEAKDRTDGATLDGTMSRLNGLSIHANPYVQGITSEITARLADHWDIGWEDTDREALVENFVAAARTVLESRQDGPNGAVMVDEALLNVFAFASAQLRRYDPVEEDEESYE